MYLKLQQNNTKTKYWTKFLISKIGCLKYLGQPIQLYKNLKFLTVNNQ